MKTGFKDPIKYKQKKDGDMPWSFKAPEYDKRTSCFIQAGCDYGIGHKQPVGHFGNPKQKADTLPFGRVNTLNLYHDRDDD